MAKTTTGKTALVTGGNRGIGLEVCRQLGELGHRVLVASRDETAGEKAAAELRGGGAEAEALELDVASQASVEACAVRLKKAGVAVDVLVNNAGVYPPGGVLDAAEKDIREAVETNFLGAWRMCRALVPGMIERGWGRVVNVTSGYGLFSEGLDGPAPYTLSKAALGALTVKLAAEAGGTIKVNGVCPGWVRTRMGGENAPRTPAKGAETIVWAATLPDDGPTGQVFRDKRRLDW
jgi:NAD(P)-dependent dehydrogenase (short-subunit alcohol dehydrogenase family)